MKKKYRSWKKLGDFSPLIDQEIQQGSELIGGLQSLPPISSKPPKQKSSTAEKIFEKQ